MNKRITLKLVKNKTKQAISFLHLTSSYSFIRVTLGAVVCHAVYPFSPISPTHEKCIVMSAQTPVISMVCYGYQEERNINTNPDYCRTMDTEMSLRCSPGLNITMELYGTADHSNLYGPRCCMTFISPTGIREEPRELKYLHSLWWYQEVPRAKTLVVSGGIRSPDLGCSWAIDPDMALCHSPGPWSQVATQTT